MWDKRTEIYLQIYDEDKDCFTPTGLSIVITPYEKTKEQLQALRKFLNKAENFIKEHPHPEMIQFRTNS